MVWLSLTARVDEAHRWGRSMGAVDGDRNGDESKGTETGGPRAQVDNTGATNVSPPFCELSFTQ